VTTSHILLISSGAEASTGGVERFTFLLQRTLRENGWSTGVISPADVNPETCPSRLAYQLGASPLLLAKALARRVAEGPKPDLIISNGTLGAFANEAPRIHVYHGTMVAHTLRGDAGLPLRERFRRLAGYGLAEAVAGRGAVRVAVSEAAASEVSRYYRLSVDAVIPNGVDTGLFAPRDRAEARALLGLRSDTRYGLFVGRIERRKGADLLLPACRAAGWELLVAGGDAVGAHNLGVLEPDQLAAAYAAADAVLFPTRYEGCSFVVLEALSSGVPLVTTDVGWVPTFLRYIPEYRPLIVSPTLVDVVAGLRAAETTTRALTERARAWVVAHAGLDEFSRRWIELVESVVHTSRSPGAIGPRQRSTAHGRTLSPHDEPDVRLPDRTDGEEQGRVCNHRNSKRR
jgi:glycosyltransferase involved in cell wall biosynthesis